MTLETVALWANIITGAFAVVAGLGGFFWWLGARKNREKQLRFYIEVLKKLREKYTDSDQKTLQILQDSTADIPRHTLVALTSINSNLGSLYRLIAMHSAYSVAGAYEEQEWKLRSPIAKKGNES